MAELVRMQKTVWKCESKHQAALLTLKHSFQQRREVEEEEKKDQDIGTINYEMVSGGWPVLA